MAHLLGHPTDIDRQPDREERSWEKQMLNQIIIVPCITVVCSLIYELCLHKHTRFFVSTATSQNCSASLEIYQAVYQYLLDNPVSGPSFVPTVIAALHPSNSREVLWCGSWDEEASPAYVSTARILDYSNTQYNND